MAIKASGPISFSDDIVREFGLPPGNNLGAYRVSDNRVFENGGSLSNLPLDVGIPQSGPIAFSSFYSKKLNIVVDLYSIPQNSTRLIVKNRYKPDNAVTIIGGFKQPVDLPQNGDGKRIIANVNRTIGSQKTGRNYCALRTGTWGTDVDLEIVVGAAGTIIGAGGDGGNGGGISGGSAGNGRTGSSALGLQYPTKIINNGNIVAGRGGGGGGAGAYGRETNSQRRCDPPSQSPKIGGAGGAGGRGLPGGTGGTRNTKFFRLSNKQGGSRTFATSGTSGSVLSNGNGGSRGVIVPQDGASCSNQNGRSGFGGAAGDAGANAVVSTRDGYSTGNASSPGSGGTSGYAIIIDSTSGNLISFTGTPVDGTNETTTVQ